MIGLHPFPGSDQENRENWRVTSEVLDRLYLEFFLEPGMGGLYQTAVPAAASAATPRANAALFPDAVTSVYLVNLPVRPRFQRMAYQADIDYTSSAGGVANFTLQTDLWLTTPGGNLLTDPGISVGAIAAPGPTNAYDEKRVTITSGTGTLISPLYRHMRFRLIRLGAVDANNNEFLLLGVYLRLFGA